MKKLLMVTVSILALSNSHALAEESDGTSDAYHAAYVECSKLADEQATVDDGGVSEQWEKVLSECFQDKGFTAPNEDEYSPEDFPPEIMPDEEESEDSEAEILEDTSY